MSIHEHQTKELLPVMGLWIGDRLPPIARLSMKSFLSCGHPYRLYAYREFEGVPAGVELRDASEILPESRVYITTKKRSYATFSNWFRWELLSRHAGWWADMDMVCLKPLALAGELVAGLQEDPCDESLEACYKSHENHNRTMFAGPLINNALVKCERPDHAVVRRLRNFCRRPERFLLDRVRHRHLVRKNLAAARSWRATWPWHWRQQLRLLYGSHLNGPWALTDAIVLARAFKGVKGRELFYSVRWEDCPTLFDGTYADVADPFPNSYAVHLWNVSAKMLGVDLNGNIPPESYVGRMMKRHSIEPYDAFSARGAETAYT